MEFSLPEVDLNLLATRALERATTAPEFVVGIVLSGIIALTVFSVRAVMLRSLKHRFVSKGVARQWRRTSGYIAFLLIGGLALPLWFDGFGSVGTFLGLLTAVVAVALAQPIQSIAGWAHIVIRRPFVVGSRISLGDQHGIVQDITLFSTALLQVDPERGFADLTGRMVHVQNRLIFDAVVISNPQPGHMVWHERAVVITYDSDWSACLNHMTTSFQNALDPVLSPTKTELMRAIDGDGSQEFGLDVEAFVNVVDHGIELTVRFPCPPSQLRRVEHIVWTSLLPIIAASRRIELAYPTHRTVFSPIESPQLQSQTPPFVQAIPDEICKEKLAIQRWGSKKHSEHQGWPPRKTW